MSITVNPLVDSSTISGGVITNSRKKEIAVKEVQNGIITANFVGMNNGISICAEAAACCWDKPVPESYEGKADFVARRVRVGHTSVLEHSNIITYLRVDNAYTDSLVEFLSYKDYLHSWTHKSKDGTYHHLLLGGSARGYADLYRATNDLNNPILKAVTGELQTYVDSTMFEDIIKLELLDKSKFSNPVADSLETLIISTDRPESNDLFDIVSHDSMGALIKNLDAINPEIVQLMDVYDILPFLTVTVLFKDMARIITQQLCRHRNGITQESQRYVDYSKSHFKSPTTFVDQYDPEHKYHIDFGPIGSADLNLQELGDLMSGVYGQLNNPDITGKEFALKREDARAYLPSNTKCRKIYITFTYKYLLKFLDLREDKAAQAEIRHYATNLGDWFRKSSIFDTKELCEEFVKPRLLCNSNIGFSLYESSDTTESTVVVTEEDYIKAAGLDIPEETTEG